MVPALVCEGQWCAAGGVDPVKAAPGTIRGDHALNFVYNIAHGCRSPESAERQSRSTFWSSSTLSRRPPDDTVLPAPGIRGQRDSADGLAGRLSFSWPARWCSSAVTWRSILVLRTPWSTSAAGGSC